MTERQSCTDPQAMLDLLRMSSTVSVGPSPFGANCMSESRSVAKKRATCCTPRSRYRAGNVRDTMSRFSSA